MGYYSLSQANDILFYIIIDYLLLIPLGLTIAALLPYLEGLVLLG